MRVLDRESWKRAAEAVTDSWGVKAPSPSYFHLLLEGFRYGGPFPLGVIREMHSLRDQVRMRDLLPDRMRPS